MKKLLFLVLAVILITGTFLVSCGEPEASPTSSPTASPTTSPTSSPTASPTSSPTASPTSSPTASPTTSPSVTPTPPATTVPPTPSGDPLAKQPGGKEGGWLVLPASADISNIGSTNEISNPGDAAYSFVSTEGLLATDASGNYIPWLAESWEMGPGGAYVDFKLHQGIKFHDGVDFNAQAVKVNVDIQMNSPVWTNLRPLESSEIIDDYTIRLHFDNDKFDWYVLNSLAVFFSCRMFSPDFLLNETDEYKRSHVVGTGPFIFSEYSRGQYIKYVRNDNYWRGKPYLEGIEYRIIPQAETQLLAFKAGEIHFVGIQPKDAAGMIAEGYEVRETADFVFNGGLMGSAANPDSPWADINVRRAAAHAIDQDLIIEALTYGYGKKSNQVYIEGQAWYNPNTVGYEYNPELSRQLLALAGYPNGFNTKWWLLDFMSQDIPLAVQDMLREVGINAEFELVSMPIFNSMVATGWEGIVWGGVFAGNAVEPAGAMVNGVLNGKTTWISCLQPDELYQKALLAASELDPAKRALMYQEISKSLTDDYCQIAYLPWTPGLTSYSPKLHGYVLGYSTFAYTFAWLD